MEQNEQDRVAAVEDAVALSRDHLIGIQYPQGYWWGELESNPTMEAEYILLFHFLGIAKKDQIKRLANHIISAQREDGTWGQFYDAPGDLSTSTECYFALKLSGVSAEEPFMRRAREFILSRGGVPGTRMFTKIWLSLFGQYEWKGVPVMPPEIMLLPSWSPITIYDFSSWARATIVPLLILLDKKPVRSVPDYANVDELYPNPRSETDYSIKRPKKLIGWEAFFFAGDTVLRQLEKLPWNPTRSMAVQKAEQWILEHQEKDGSWGGIQPPWVYSLMALNSLGYPLDHPVITNGLAGFETFSIQESDTERVQACLSPLWDTCLSMIALLDAGVDPDDPALVKAGEYLVNEQIVMGGDWQVKAKDVTPGGWAFEFHNDLYPDLDDTSEVVMAINRIKLPSEADKRKAIQRATRWLLGMQCANGGWAAFDKDNSKVLIARIPFADFGETIDPPSVDVTAHVLEMLGQLGFTASHPAVEKALKYVLSEQEEDGPWFGRWGVNYVYGTGAVLPALASLGVDMKAPFVRKAVDWLMSHQNEDGGWGESCASYVDPSYRGRGPSTASQTSWAIMALLASGEAHNPATLRGVEYLVETQLESGSWDEPFFTGTGFPGYGIGQRLNGYLSSDERGFQGAELPAGFMINYHMYRDYWPLSALGRYVSVMKGERHPSTSGLDDVPTVVLSPVESSRRKRLKQLLPIW